MTRFPSLIAASLLATFSPLPLWAVDSEIGRAHV